ncbi:MAG: GNAT family N-acetyltransferase [Woeseiaceae bacterium]|nr:GNAT family N-acetyltransferase [Woeseiaceae bacterium]
MVPRKVDIEFLHGDLSPAEQSLVSEGFDEHTVEKDAPRYAKERVKWLVTDERGDVRAALTADILWDWLYVDELWVAAELRGKGVGRELMQRAEELGRSSGLQGIWLWTQSWQAEGFYERLGYVEFTRFEDFPKGHSRIGFRKALT